MKKNIFIFALSVFAFMSCQQEELASVGGREFSAIIEDFDSQTKTTLDITDNSVVWSSNDKIAVFQGSTLPDIFAVSPESVGDVSGLFHELSTSSEGQIPGSEIEDNVAVYPISDNLMCTKYSANENAGISSYKIENVVFPYVQTREEKSFSDSTFVMVAVTDGTEDNTLRFRNVSGAIRFRISGDAVVKSILFQGNSDEILSGNATVYAYRNDVYAPSVTMAPDADKAVLLDCGRGVTLKKDYPADFILSLPPTTFKNGFTVIICDITGKTIEKRTENNLSVGRSKILNMPEIEFVVSSRNDDYVDEYGENHGPGIEIDNIVWAPVNCGYKAADAQSKGYPYGKLYQWGRKYGHGYSYVYDDSCVSGTYKGPVSLHIGESENYKELFITATYDPFDWLDKQNDKLWNNGTEKNPLKTEYDPCPDGWRVPTASELKSLTKNKSAWITTEDGIEGYCFSGSSPYSPDVPHVFLPTSGYISYQNGKSDARNKNANYWSSSVTVLGDSQTADYKSYSQCLFTGSNYVSVLEEYYRAYGCSVRCVRD